MPHEKTRQVEATMKISRMDIPPEFKKRLEEVVDGKETSEHLREEIIKENLHEER